MNENALKANELIEYLKIVQEPIGIEIIVLRSHLLAEEKLKEIIKDNVKRPESLDSSLFSFNQNLMLAESMKYSESNAWIWECLKLLNSVRNKMAHNLMSHKKQDINNKLDRLDLLIGKHSGVPIPKSMQPGTTRLVWRLSTLYSEILKL